MWTVANTTSYAVQADLLRDRTGAETLVVVVKGTFRYDGDGSCDVDEEQCPVVATPQYTGHPGRSSLACDSDLVPAKPTTDVLLSGAAYRTSQADGNQVLVQMAVGPVSKRLRVSGDRHWERGPGGWRASGPISFERMPIVYERALGGSIGVPAPDGRWPCDSRNPVGRGFGGGEHRETGDLLPNIEYDDSRELPAGFGPISRHWSPRIELAGTYGSVWRKQRFPLVPEDFDDRFYNAAPLDQQPARHLTGGEPVFLENLSPGGVQRFALPKVYLAVNTQIGGDVESHRPQLHTVLLKPDEERVVMTWVGALNCHGRTTKIRRIHVREKPRITLRTSVALP